MKEKISIVIPYYNETENVERSIEEITKVIKDNNLFAEIIAVDDGSADGTRDLLMDLAGKTPFLKVIIFARNFGQSAALAAGFDASEGEIVITLDGDCQNDPSDIPALLKKIDEGFDVVSGWRFKRKDLFIARRFPSSIANFIISKITGVELHDYGCTLKAYRRSLLKYVKLYGELHRFLPALCMQAGAKIIEIKVNHRQRTKGRSKYNIIRTFRVILDLITVKYFLTYSSRPMHIFGSMGLVFIGIGLFMGMRLTILHFIIGHDVSSKVPSIILLAILMIFGFQFIIFGLLAEIVIKSTFEIGKKTPYIISNIIPSSDRGHDL